MSTRSLFTISRLADEANVGVETVRFYERKGLIKQPSKGKNAFREYADTDAGRIRFIKRAQELGFTLAEIKKIFLLEQNFRINCDDLKKKVDVKINEVDLKIADLNRIKTSLVSFSSACAKGENSVRECKISDCFEKKDYC